MSSVNYIGILNELNYEIKGLVFNDNLLLHAIIKRK